ncbi:MAG TPA: PIN domain-containing protein [Methyloceanibacter sp.]|nr:PIN domain-containing protein [Methyloceanibacter sp.]
MISTFSALFDSNVLYGARIRSLLMEFAMSGLFRARWSADINREWIAAVHAKTGIELDRLQNVADCMERAVPDAIGSGYEVLIPGLTLPDPKDRHVLAAAIRCGASVIVTFNDEDFPRETLEVLGISTRHPDDFILDIEDISPGTLIEAARADIDHYVNPKLTVEEYVSDLAAAGVPKTAARLTRLRDFLRR